MRAIIDSDRLPTAVRYYTRIKGEPAQQTVNDIFVDKLDAVVRPERRRVVLAGASPDRVSVAAPGSRLQREGETCPSNTGDGIGLPNCPRMKLTSPPEVASAPIYPFRQTVQAFHFQRHMSVQQFRDARHNRDSTESRDTTLVGLRSKTSLDFLGYTFRWDRDLYGRAGRYLNVAPSKKALQRQRERINDLTDRRQGCTPIPRLIARLNRQLRGWANYFSYGYPRKAYGKIDWHVGYRLANHLKHHRSQRPYRLPKGVTYYQNFQRLGLEFIRLQPCESRRPRFSGEPDAGNLHVRFDEGTVGHAQSPTVLLYRPRMNFSRLLTG